MAKRRTRVERKIIRKNCKYCGKEFIAKSHRNMYCSVKCSNEWKSVFGFQYKPVKSTADTKCWNCKRATGGSFCPWANWFLPVEGWVATPTRVKMSVNRTCKSYVVHECPIFERG